LWLRNLVIVLVLAVILPLHSQTTRKYSNEFLNIGVDAAALGMSNAVTAQTANVNSGYWNPAGLVQLEDQQIALMHSSYFANIANYNYIAWAKPIDDRSAVGISLIRFGVDDILDTTQLIDDQGNINYDRISTFSTADYALTVSYARRMPIEGFSYGINAKIIRRIIGDFANSWGFGFDAGLQFVTKNNWKIGIMGRDITTTYNSWAIDESNFSRISDAIEGENQELPENTEITIPKLELGISKSWIFHYDYSLEAAVNFNVRFTETNAIISSSVASIDPAFGFQFGFVDMVFLRGGLGNFQNELQIDNSQNLTFQPNFGVGFKYKGIQLDYAFTDIGDQSAALYSNVFSLMIDLSIFR